MRKRHDGNLEKHFMFLHRSSFAFYDSIKLTKMDKESSPPGNTTGEGFFIGGRPMPRRPKVPCRHPGCSALVEPGEKYCEEHKKLHPEEVRSAASRGYSSRWNKARRAFLAAHPLCEECLKEGRYTKATVVDHIIPHRGDPKLFWDESNWQALCKRHHDEKTGREDSHPNYHY